MILKAISQARPGKRQIFWTAVAGGLGLVLTYLDFPILPGLTLVYTGVCYLLIALAYGPVAGVLCSVLGMARTVFMFGDGYSVLVAALESAVIGHLTRKRYSTLTAALIFWVLIGLPVLLILVFAVMKPPAAIGWALILKRIVNGFVNVTIADFLLMGPGVLRALEGPGEGSPKRSLRQLISAVFLLATMLPILFLSIVHGRSFAQHEEREARLRVQEAAQTVRKEVDEYLQKHLEAIVSLERSLERSDTLDPLALRERLRQQNEIYRGFLTMLAADGQGRILATNAPGGGGAEATAKGRRFIDDRDYFKHPIHSGKPYISDVFLGRGLGRDPIVAVSAPLRGHSGEVLGLVEGSLDLSRFRRFEDSYRHLEDTDILVLDQHDRVIYTSQRLHYGVLSEMPAPFLEMARKSESLPRLSDPEKSYKEAQRRGILSYAKSDLTGWQTIVQQSILPLQRQIEDYYLHSLVWLILAVVAALALARRVALRITTPLETLAGALRDFDVAEPAGASVALTPSAPAELTQIQTHFNELSERLADSHVGMVHALAEKEGLNDELHTVLADLDHKVQVRTVELAEARVRAETASKAKSIFLANMSHEIRTPLNAVLGYSQLMLRDSDLGAESRRYLNIVNSSGEHLLALLNEILDMSRIEAGRMKVDPVAFDLPRLIHDLADMFRLRASGKGLAFEVVEGDGMAGRIVADQGKIRQVLINLLGNAVKFTERGGIKLHISTTTRQEGQLWLATKVEDTGVGIADEEMARLFQPFAQATSGLHVEGTGLGLVISREYARLMGGDLTANSQAGRGAVFLFEVPVEASEDSVAATGLPPVSVKRVQPGDERRVLVVDDDPSSREWIGSLLRSVGFLVREADNGESGIRITGEWHPHLILMDLRMPVLNGFDAARGIRERMAGEQPVIIALSASALGEDRRAAIESGADLFFSKPCRAQELLETIAEHLEIGYEYSDPAREAEPDWAGTPAARAARLRAMPAEWVEELHQATRNGEKDRMDRAIEKLMQQDRPMAAILQELADRYEYDSLAELCADAQRG